MRSHLLLAAALALSSAKAQAQCSSAPADAAGRLAASVAAGPWCGKGSDGRIGWLGASGVGYFDATDRFKSTLQAVQAGTAGPLPADAKSYVYLVIKGLYGNQLLGYMDSNLERLQGLGLDARLVDLNTEGAVADNAEVVAAAIRQASAGGKQVVIVGHSKGGVDAAAALALHPELASRVRALIPIQSPYGGSPVAQDIQGCPFLKSVTDGFVSDFWGGNPQSMIDLTYDARQKFIADHPLPGGVPIVGVMSSREPEITSAMWPTAQYMRDRYGVASDGLVVPSDAVFPNADMVQLDDMDHAEGGLVGIPGARNYEPGEVTEALLRMALSKPRSGA